MPLEHIIGKIEAEAREKAARIAEEASTEAERLRGEAGKKRGLETDALIAGTRKKIEEERRGFLAASRLDARNRLLAKKHGIIEEVFNRAFEKVKGLGDEEYKDFMMKLLLKLAGGEKYTVYVSGKDARRIDAGFISGVNRALREAGKKEVYELAGGHADIEGGFIIKSGKVSVNASLEVLFKHARERLEAGIAQTLFGEPEPGGRKSPKNERPG